MYILIKNKKVIKMDKIVTQFLEEVNRKNQNEPEFMQAVTEVAEHVIPYVYKNDIYYGQNILLRIVEPERVILRLAPIKEGCAFTRV
jgi:glutamate dehydrogenase (NADP+)